MTDKTNRLRKAILGMTAMDQFAPNVTPEDVKKRWSHLSASGSTPYDLAEEANAEVISEERFKFLMALMNSRL
ncbi:TPA: hypothetical protein I7264_25735 [Vibrio parahaemolyticus]|uniref:hypothetical protein n=1 Tax=Vibrio parahaemolyticus TaxID=670 RepID=UPI001A1D00FB|nr:hypothetical protein [Vibrio parahaemolyticus]HAS6615051.1 hypothetical protein [Vibrio parahaemolyticus]HAS6625676.1 hypothetical protein [Vibrio parahaemolyticus]HAS6636196.1 hypothetical protein [Vibrio parahaemolyticus]HAS6652715.1 hypothetical protein [Vibrio parahaemolyticus]HAS6658064.1 hypothetical protein [Vibrio parahaemolyticus]